MPLPNELLSSKTTSTIEEHATWRRKDKRGRSSAVRNTNSAFLQSPGLPGEANYFSHKM